MLPAGAAAQQSVGDAQVDQAEDDVDEADRRRAIRGRRPLRQAPPPSARALHPADRRDGLRRRVPGDGPRALRPRASAWRASGSSSTPASTAPACDRSAAPAEELGLAARSVKASAPQPRSDAAAGDRATGTATTGWCCTTSTGRHVRRGRSRASGCGGCRASEFERSGAATRRCSTTRRPSSRRREPSRGARPGCGRSSGRTPGSSLQGARAGRGRQRAADGAAGLHPGHRRPRAGRAGPVAAAPAHRRHGRDDGVHRRVAARRSATC